MKSAQTLLGFMDRLHNLINRINEYIEQGLEIFLKVRDWVHKIIEYLEQGISKLKEYVEDIEKEDLLQFQQDDLFV
jgi:hypothetical protein